MGKGTPPDRRNKPEKDGKCGGERKAGRTAPGDSGTEPAREKEGRGGTGKGGPARDGERKEGRMGKGEDEEKEKRRG